LGVRAGKRPAAPAALSEQGEARLDELLTWLGRNDALTLGERVERLADLVALNEEFAAGWLGFYGQAHDYLEYAARCYLEGLFAPCIIMCQTAAEEQVRGLLRSSPLEELAAQRMRDILRDKRVREALGRPLVRRLEALRGRRNAYVHPPGPFDAEGGPDSRWLPHRMATQKKEAEELLRDDAWKALRTIAAFFAVPATVFLEGAR
jgi:HEPN domain-containing protein